MISFTCHECNKGNHGDCAGGVNTGGNCTCCPNRY